jgi:alkanesulfonate monooxygenase SsuD/methylene tetrahydromethanopterin reductase-like flavin-dependent oxidoreductase (luciferase family)
MRFGLVMRTDVPLREIPALAREAEEAGWDGFFIWDAPLGANAWVLLGAVAAQTERIRFGTMLTPPTIRRPWQLAAEAVTLDQLSHGRLTMTFGLGAAADMHYARLGEAEDRKTRAERLDESLDIITGLWAGEALNYAGQHYRLEGVSLQLQPVQKPRIPIWVVGAWGSAKSMRRVLRCDGIIPAKMTPQGPAYDLTPDDTRAILAHVAQERQLSSPFDFVLEGETPGDNPAAARALVAPQAQAGATWWLESLWGKVWEAGGLEAVKVRVRQGPPGP